jgi:hypothetical protein
VLDVGWALAQLRTLPRAGPVNLVIPPLSFPSRVRGLCCSQVKQVFDTDRGLYMPYLPMGRFVHVPPSDPVFNWKNDFGLPWWQVSNVVLCLVSLSACFSTLVTSFFTHDSVWHCGGAHTCTPLL